MRVFNGYMLWLTGSILLIAVIMAAAAPQELTLAVILMAIAYLVITLLFVNLNPRTRGALNGISLVLFGIFIWIVAVKVIEILYR